MKLDLFCKQCEVGVGGKHSLPRHRRHEYTAYLLTRYMRKHGDCIGKTTKLNGVVDLLEEMN